MPDSPQLILFSGLPATGKSTLAQALSFEMLIPLFTLEGLRDRVLPQRLLVVGPSLHDYYAMVRSLAECQLRLGISVIVESLFPTGLSRQPFFDLADELHIPFRPVFTYCSDATLWRQRMMSRIAVKSDQQTDLGWDASMNISKSFENWDESITLFVDTVSPIEDNLKLIHAHVLT
jgi:hypothetical protein